MRQFKFDILKKLPPGELRITFSTAVTFIRIMLAPFVVCAMLTGRWGSAWFLFSIAAATDTLDGLVARWCNQRTFLGTCLDPIADKFLLVSCFTALACTHTLPFSIPKFFLLLILLRETLLIAGAFAIYVLRGYIHVQPTRLGKLTMFMQVIFIEWLFACYFFDWVPVKTYYVFIIGITTLIIASFMQYGHRGFRQWYKD